jgi:hypothetical protein
VESVGSPFNHKETVITASAGDDGYLNWGAEANGAANFPAVSPHVVAVGGTHLKANLTSGTYEAESVWNGDGAGGGGCSKVFSAPSWQQEVTDWEAIGCGKHRAVSDVSADADPIPGVAIYDSDGEGCEESGYSNPNPKWCPVGGTSLASPLIAATFALAGGAHGAYYPAKTLYENEAVQPDSLNDVQVGSNGECTSGYEEDGESRCSPSKASEQCAGKGICLARPGYDGPTGVGTPFGLKAFEPAPVTTKPKESAGGELWVEELEAETSRHRQQRLEEEEIAVRGSKTTTTGSTTGTPTGSPVAGPAVQITSFGITVKGLIALNKRHPKLSHLNFAFSSSVPLDVTVALSMHKRVRGHVIWQSVGRPLKGLAVVGRNSWNMRGGTLKRGSYRLTLSAPGVPTKAITFLIG